MCIRDRSLTGDDKISVSHIITKSGFIQYDLNAGFQRSRKKRLKSKSKSARSTRSGKFRVNVRECFPAECGVGGKRCVHTFDHDSIRALLRSENGAAAVGTAERIRYIAGNTEGAFRKFRQNVICRNRGKRFQSDSTKRNLFSFCIEQSETCLLYTSVWDSHRRTKVKNRKLRGKILSL